MIAVSDAPKDTRLMLERLVSTLEELHEMIQTVDNTQRESQCLQLIENMLDDYRAIYGRGHK